MGSLIRDLLELAIVVGLGGMIWQVAQRGRRGDLRVYRCVACARPTSRAYPRCKHCNTEQPDAI